jgi:hypothetical protein
MLKGAAQAKEMANVFKLFSNRWVIKCLQILHQGGVVIDSRSLNFIHLTVNHQFPSGGN